MNKKGELTTANLKRILLNHFRFKKGMYCATEVDLGICICDILAISNKKQKSIEVEIKVNKEDIVRDFVQKEYKHESFRDCNINTHLKPNYLYFCVPDILLEDLLTILENENKRYGIIVINKYEHVEFYRQAKELNYKNNEEIYRRIIMRATSEVVRFHNKLNELGID